VLVAVHDGQLAREVGRGHRAERSGVVARARKRGRRGRRPRGHDGGGAVRGAPRRGAIAVGVAQRRASGGGVAVVAGGRARTPARRAGLLRFIPRVPGGPRPRRLAARGARAAVLSGPLVGGAWRPWARGGAARGD